jgi:hypothetical protein
MKMKTDALRRRPGLKTMALPGTPRDSAASPIVSPSANFIKKHVWRQKITFIKLFNDTGNNPFQPFDTHLFFLTI